MPELRQYTTRIGVDTSAFDRSIAASALAAAKLDASVDSLVSRIGTFATAGTRAGQVQREAGSAAQGFVVAIEREGAALAQHPQRLAQVEAGLTRIKAAELGVTEQSGAAVAAIERLQQIRTGGPGAALGGLDPGAVAAVRRQLDEQADAQRRVTRAKADFVAQLEREIAALRREADLQSQSRSQSSGAQATASDRVAQAQAIGAGDAAFVAKVQPLAADLGAARAAQQQQQFIAALDRTAQAAGRTRAEWLALQAAELGVSAQAAPLIARIAATDRQFQSFAKTGRLAGFELQQVGFQLQDFFVQVSSGQNPLTALIQQGAQLQGTFGGAGTAIRAVLSLLTPRNVTLGGLAVGAGAFAVAMYRAESATRDLNTVLAQLSATGRADLFSSRDLKAFIDQLALAPGVSRSAATGIVSELSKVHDISGPLFRDLAGLAADYAKATGTDIPAATKALATAFTNPAEGAKTLDAALGRLTSTQLLTIDRLVRQNDLAGAQRALFDALKGSIGGLANDALTPLQRSTNELGNAWERAMQALDKSESLKKATTAVAGLVDKIKGAIDALPEFERNWNKAFAGGLNGAVLRALGLGGNQAATPERAPFTGGASGSFAPSTGGASGTFGTPLVSKAEEEIKRALEAGKAYKGQATQIAELTQQRKAFNSALTQAIALYGRESEQVKALRSSLSDVDERIKAAQNKGQPDNELKRETDALVRGAQRTLDAEKAQIDEQQQELRADYEGGLVSLADYYARRNELSTQAAGAEQKALDAQVAAFEREQRQAKTPETREDATNKLVEAVDRQEQITAKAGSERARLRREQQRDEIALGQRLLEQEAELAQLRGDDAAAEAIRNQQRIADFARVANQARPDDGPDSAAAAQQRVSSFADLIERQGRFNELQRQVAQTTERAQTAEDAYLLSARQRGLSQEETERGVHLLRQQALGDLGALVDKVDELAAASGDPRMKLFADNLGLQFAKALDEIDPALARLRSVADEAGQSIAGSFGDAIVNGGKLSDVIRKIDRDLVSIVTSEVVTKPLGDAISKTIKGGFTPGGGGLLDQLGASAIKIIGGGTSGGGGGPAVGALVASATGTGDFARADRGQEGASFTAGLEKAASSVASLGGASGASAVVLGNLPQLAAIPATAAMATLATAAEVASAALVRMAASAAAGAGSSGAGLLNLGGLIGGGGGFGSGANFGNQDLGLFFHTGGVVGAAGAGTLSPVPERAWDAAPRYHAGGIAGLSPNEVPAILMGGPRGLREEVLTAQDPRHADNGGLLIANVVRAMGGMHDLLANAHAASPALARLTERIVVGAHHTGGIAGHATTHLQVPAHAFLNAPVFHDGGVVQSRSDDPGILRIAQQPLTASDPRAVALRGGGDRSHERGLSQTFVLPNRIDRSTQDQIAAKALIGARRASRNL